MGQIQAFKAADGRRLSYYRDGDGVLVVMLPGGPGLDPLAYFAGAEVPGVARLVLCPRGTGQSDPPSSPEGYRIAGYIEDVEYLRSHLGVAQLNLYGSSHGASIALAYATAFPGRVECMVLAGGPARMDERFASGLAAARDRFRAKAPDGDARLKEADQAQASMRQANTDEDRRRALSTVIKRYVAQLGERETAFLARLCDAPINFAAPAVMGAEMVGGLDLLGNPGAIEASTLVIAGDLDTTVPAEHMQEIADAIPDAEFLRLAGVGHFAPVEEPTTWAEVVGGFLREV